MSSVLLDERARLVARIVKIDAEMAAAPGRNFVRDTEPEMVYSPFGVDEGTGSSIGDAWCSTWVRELRFPNDLDRDAWAELGRDENLWAVVRTWYFLVTYGGGEWDVRACTAYQVCTDRNHPDATEIGQWLDYWTGDGSGWHRDDELHAMADRDEPPTVETWNQIVDKAGESWAMLGDDG